MGVLGGGNFDWRSGATTPEIEKYGCVEWLPNRSIEAALRSVVWVPHDISTIEHVTSFKIDTYA